jgi:hypothetical protein
MTVLATALVLPFSACGDDDPTSPNVDVTGTFTLRTINGEDLPVIIAQVGEDMIEVTEGTIRLNADSTFSDSTTFRITEGGVVTIEEDGAVGTYTQSGTSVTLHPSEGAPYAVSVSGNTLTQTAGAFALVYQK